MNYRETLDYLYKRLPIYQRQGKAALRPSLENTEKLLKSLGNPERQFRSIHVAGTNGKGTSCHALSSILQVSGLKTGLYTSPHLKEFTERIKINGKEIDQEYIIGFVNNLQDDIEEINPSFFELTVSMAFAWFAEQKVDIAVIETGLGGRLDSTNVIIPEVSLITNIGFDHVDLLGDTLEKIAQEKAGIIKSGVPVVIGSHQPSIEKVFQKRAADVGATFNNLASQYSLTNSDWTENRRSLTLRNGGGKDMYLSTDLLADYFLQNIPGVLEVIRELQEKGFHINDDHVTNGLNHILTNTGLKGRFQIIKTMPLVIADVSHNPEGLSALFEQVKGLKYEKLHLIFGTVKEKPLVPLFGQFPADSMVYFVSSSVPRALNSGELTKAAGKARIFGEDLVHVNNALQTVTKKAGKEDLILVTGSTFVVAEIEGL